jgi:hypothetical protein
VRTGNFVYFDNATHTIRPEHVMASGSLPPGFPAVEIDGELYWDGGLISNTPLQWVVEQGPRQDTLAFQVDLWSARGELPGNLADVVMRQKEIQYSSRTCANTDQFKQYQRARKTLASLLAKLPPDLLAGEEAGMLSSIADGFRWRSIGAPVITMRCVRCGIPKHCSGPAMMKACAPSILPWTGGNSEGPSDPRDVLSDDLALGAAPARSFRKPERSLDQPKELQTCTKTVSGPRGSPCP